MSKALDIIDKLKVVSFEWNETNEKEVGFIAEDVAKVFPEAAAYDENGTVIGIKFLPMIALCVKAIQETRNNL